MDIKTRKRTQGNSGRCGKQRSKQKYAKKRRFHGKKKGSEVEDLSPLEHQEQQEETVVIQSESAGKDGPPELPPQSGSAEKDVPSQPPTISEVKVIDIEHQQQTNSDALSGYRLIDVSILADVFYQLSCPECFATNSIKLEDVNERKKGLVRFMRLNCEYCPYTNDFFTSKEVERKPPVNKNKGGGKYMDVNIRAVYGCRAIGVGHKQLQKLCGYLDMPEPMSNDKYDNISNHIKDAARVVAERSMSDAANEIRGDNETADASVSVDGTWQRKGFTSTNGVITAISVDTGKVLDVSILSKSCKGCTSMQSIEKSDPERYAGWKASHNCNLNYAGSSPNMEKVGAENMFKRSVKKHGLYYTKFYGDGDSKAFSAVENIYGPTKKLKKYECIGHYQKRVGTRLRKLKRVIKGLGGRGRLTDAKIDILQNYFGIALRQNVGNLSSMEDACMASMYHVAEYHDKCPKGDNTWCQFQKDKLEGTTLHKSKGGLPIDVRQKILPIYVDLCKSEMLQKCLHGKTQNANESFNGMIWNRIPKANHVGIKVLSLGVYDAIAHFNYGEKASIDIMEELNMQSGEYMKRVCQVINVVRRKSAAYKMSAKQCKRRKILRHNRRKKQDKYIEHEGPSYEKGGY